MNAAAAAADDAYDKCGFSLMILVWYSLFSIGVNLDMVMHAAADVRRQWAIPRLKSKLTHWIFGKKKVQL